MKKILILLFLAILFDIAIGNYAAGNGINQKIAEGWSPPGCSPYHRSLPQQGNPTRYNCWCCPFCGKVGWEVGQQMIGGTRVTTLSCTNGHVWQCAW